MFIIMSAAYIDLELQSEFGLIPPAFLPLQNQRLFVHQIKSIPEGEVVSLAIPESYELSGFDLKYLMSNKVEIINIPDGLELGAAIVCALNLTLESVPDGSVNILLGDTLIDPLPRDKDIITVSDVEFNYNWTVVQNNRIGWLKNNTNNPIGDSPTIVNGYFSFSDAQQLIRCITCAKWDFIKGLSKYRKIVGLKEIKIEHWLDFGHVNTYFDSKSKFTTERVFNSLQIGGGTVSKESADKKKMLAEINWYKSVPVTLKINVPQLYDEWGEDSLYGYKIEYLYFSALNELFVFAKLPAVVWKKILKRCFSFLEACSSVQLKDKSCNSDEYCFTEGVIKKTSARLELGLLPAGMSLNTDYSFNSRKGMAISKLHLETSEYLRSKPNRGRTFLHGDFCFSNILYDFRADNIKAIDPRGLDFNGDNSTEGDVRYDLAKLSHSILGLYDWIVAGYFDVALQGNELEFTVDGGVQNKFLQDYFIEEVEFRFGVGKKEIYSLQIQLFLSMIPLHSEDSNRQLGLLANAYRLYYEMEDV